MPINDYECECEHEVQNIYSDTGPDTINCPKCKRRMHKVISAPGGYKINGDNSASVRPKSAGSFKKSKA